MILLGLGVVLNLVLVPIGARFGAAGVAAAMVVRSFATWPIGLWLIKRHAGVSYAEQARAGGPAFAAALVMALGVIGVLHVLGGFSPIGRLLAGGAAGAVLYPGLLVLFAPKVRRSLLGAIPLLAHGRGRAALARIRGDFLLEGGLSQAAESGSL
jgi:O-antigen/teichoic acid export membrane protein